MNPRIAVTFALDEKPSDKEYLEAVRQAGGDPVPFRPGQTVDARLFAGLVLSGGIDVEPRFYNEKKEPFCEDTNAELDQFEFAILKDFLADRKPVFAICRGIQVLNVAMGGSLYQDLQSQMKETLPQHKTQIGMTREQKRAQRHAVKVEPQSILHEFLGDEAEVNSRHHQALKAVAPALEVTALSSDGVIEAVESKLHPWVVGVQWHPEATEVYPAFAPLFKGFVSKCSERVAHAPEPGGTHPGSYFEPPDRTGAKASS